MEKSLMKLAADLGIPFSVARVVYENARKDWPRVSRDELRQAVFLDVIGLRMFLEKRGVEVTDEPGGKEDR